MKRGLLWVILGNILLTMACQNTAQIPSSKHVILLGFDAMGSYGFQRAATPCMNQMLEQGAIALNTRCVRETSSSQNWMSMISGTCIEQHGVYSNDWEPDNAPIEPTVKNAKGFYPTLFDYIYQQRPEATVYAFYQWTEQDRMYDVSHVTKRVTGYDDDTTLDMAFDAFLSDLPTFLFVSLNLPDEMGHQYGHESEEYLNSITHLDAKVGAFVSKLKERDLLKDVTILITGDHGGLRFGHGGDSPQELLTAILMYGGDVTEGKIMEHGHMIYDVGATVAGLLGVRMPVECYGKFLWEAYESATSKKYVPVPFIRTQSNPSTGSTTVSISADAPDCTIYYTTDGNIPSASDTPYKEPFEVTQSSTIKAIAYRDNQTGFVGDCTVYVNNGNETSKVAYKLYDAWNGVVLPVFDKMGRASREGVCNDIRLDGLDVIGKDHFAVQFATHLYIHTAGTYTFSLCSDDGSALYIDGQKLIDNDGSHSATSLRGSMELAEGAHSLRVDYFDDYAGEFLELSWRGPGFGERPLLGTDFM